MENIILIYKMIGYYSLYLFIGSLILYIQALRWAYREGNKRAVGGEFGFFMVFFFGIFGIFFILLSEKLYD